MSSLPVEPPDLRHALRVCYQHLTSLLLRITRSQGPHFDWGVRVRLGANESSRHPREIAVTGKFDIIHDLTGAQMRAYPRAARATRVYSNAFAHPRRLIKFNMAWAKPRLGDFAERANDMDIDHCMLRYVLAPTKELSEHADATLGERATRVGTQLVRAVATHVRMGDSMFAHAGWSNNRWGAAEELRDNPFARNVPASLKCIMRASELSRGDCAPCVLMSDSSTVGACAKTALDAPVLTAGVAIHVLASDSQLVNAERNVDKIFIDWWLLARSLVSVEFAVGSAFFATATGYKQASSPHARLIKMGNTTTAAQRESALRACGAHAAHDRLRYV